MKKFNKAENVYSKIESVLLECQEFEGDEGYNDIIDGLSRVLKAVNMIKINTIKDNDKDSFFSHNK